MFSIRLSIERWKWNADFGIYVSNKGHFRSRDKKDLPVKITQGGYCCVYCEGTVNAYRLAHRVVLLTWRPNGDAENMTVDHLNHNKRCNELDNLEWVTKAENLRRAGEDLVLPEQVSDYYGDVIFEARHKKSDNLCYMFSWKKTPIEEIMKKLDLPESANPARLKNRLYTLVSGAQEAIQTGNYVISVKQ